MALISTRRRKVPQGKKNRGENKKGLKTILPEISVGTEKKEMPPPIEAKKKRSIRNSEKTICKRKRGSKSCLKASSEGESRKVYKCDSCQKEFGAFTDSTSPVPEKKRRKKAKKKVGKCHKGFVSGGGICKRWQEKPEMEKICAECEYSSVLKREADFNKDGENTFDPTTIATEEISAREGNVHSQPAI